MAATAFWWACMGLSALCALLLLALLALYWRHMRRVPSRFSRGLVAFAGLFFLEAVGSLWVWRDFAAEYDADVAIPMMVLRGLEVLGAGILLVVSWE